MAQIQQEQKVRMFRLMVVEYHILELLSQSTATAYDKGYDDIDKYAFIKRELIRFHNKLAKKCQLPLL